MPIDESIFEAFPDLHTPRLHLRCLEAGDAQKIYEMRKNKQVNRFIARPEIDTLGSAQELVERTVGMYEQRKGIGWAGILRDGEQIIGTCGFNGIDYLNNRAEIGGELSTEYWGKGIAGEAVVAILAFGLEKMNLHAIEAKVMPGNRGAVYLLESLGFKQEAHFRDRIYFQNQYHDLAVYTLLESEAEHVFDFFKRKNIGT